MYEIRSPLSFLFPYSWLCPSLTLPRSFLHFPSPSSPSFFVSSSRYQSFHFKTWSFGKTSSFYTLYYYVIIQFSFPFLLLKIMTMIRGGRNHFYFVLVLDSSFYLGIFEIVWFGISFPFSIFVLKISSLEL